MEDYKKIRMFCKHCKAGYDIDFSFEVELGYLSPDDFKRDSEFRFYWECSNCYDRESEYSIPSTGY